MPKKKWTGLGEVLLGNHLIDSDYVVRFKLNTPKTKICDLPPTTDGLQYWMMIQSQYYFEMFVGMVHF